MSLKLTFKSFFFRFLEILPNKQGEQVYHKVQELFSKENLDFKIRSSHNTFRTFQDITREQGIEIKDRVVIEIGSGWLPLMPYFFRYMGKAEKVETFDLNRHYQRENIEKLNEAFSGEYEVEINKVKESAYSLPEAIKYYPNSNILDQKLTNCDLVFSRFVLEHLRPETIKSMHLKFKKELKPGAHIVHLISPGDHRAYLDKELSLQDFLKYSRREWQKKQTRFDYHNRLRLPEYLEIFNNLDLKIVHLTYEVPDRNSEYYRKFEALNLHPDFTDFTDEELMAGAINIILKV
ncbi:hypothetical protein [Gramella sp. MAR_2010_147]|uniref:hypothetical protein n=1 Tax=Gramella sp. MAR_2010_147 TaxID=1250205 RepID=UPI00087C1E81|nr:hypothetical protein [Gramella sp. MAR_2010_147]SDS01418.1 hypothetical protein SAMN04488553_1265 [Gramella sp. MAR_2010_147]